MNNDIDPAKIDMDYHTWIMISDYHTYSDKWDSWGLQVKNIFLF